LRRLVVCASFGHVQMHDRYESRLGLRACRRWLDMRPEAEIAATILRLVEVRGADKSICPSEVARALDPAWQRLMGPVRQAAIGLAVAGRIDILRQGKPVDPVGVRGVIRLRLRDPEETPSALDAKVDD
jgi:hypothetical protein